MEDEEPLETSALVGQLADPVQHQINELPSHSVVATSIVVSSVFLASDELFRVEELPVGTCPNLIC